MSPAPASVHAEVATVLRSEPDHRREEFAIRLDHWWDDLVDGLRIVYPSPGADELALRTVLSCARAYADRDPQLRRLDAERTLDPEWFQASDRLGYATYADRFAGDLQGVRQRIPYLRELGVNYLHLLPLLRPREDDSDGGYAVADYRAVRADLGDIDDLRALATGLRAEGVSLVMDLVLNHVAREHDWAERARAGDPRYRDYFHWFGDRAMPDAYERTLPEVFPDFAPGNFSWDADLDAWVWTTFNSWQWDVNWANPDVFHEYAEIVLFLANLGVEVLRLDAIAFVWKRLGTNCQNQPEVHAITQALRTVARIAAPALAFKAEAIVAPADLVQYFGTGSHHGKLSDLAYHNSLMVQIWSMLAAGDARLAAQALQALPATPTTTAWITYVRCHDDIGWAIDDADAAAVGLNGFEHRRFLSDYYAGDYPGTPARGLVFQANPVTGDRRISGMTAGLTGLQAAADANSGELREIGIARALLGYAIVFGWGGVPVLWMGDELGLLDDPKWAEEPGHETDNRWAHRPRMDWSVAERRNLDGSVEQRMFSSIQALAEIRAQLPHLDASVAAQVVTLADPGVLPVLRHHPVGNLLELFNVSGTSRPWPGARLDEYGLRSAVDALTGEPPNWGDDDNIWLAPYQAVWLTHPA
ncbi:MAG: alpha amylase catalytic region [Pseudonocardiales bacterium]|nr:alpha amylase catalytic region [Pseudonocardiales bacterium]